MQHATARQCPVYRYSAFERTHATEQSRADVLWRAWALADSNNNNNDTNGNAAALHLTPKATTRNRVQRGSHRQTVTDAYPAQPSCWAAWLTDRCGRRERAERQGVACANKSHRYVARSVIHCKNPENCGRINSMNPKGARDTTPHRGTRRQI
jgi:hypothetical protein